MADVFTGVEQTYTGSVIIVRQLEDYIDNFQPNNFPLLSRVGLNSYPERVHNVMVEWQFDEYIPMQDALDADIVDVAHQTIEVERAEIFALHDVILIDEEMMLVLSADPVAGELTVVRGFAGSVAALHADGDPIYRQGTARPEGSSPGWAQQVLVQQPYNYTQIWDVVVSITGTQDAVDNHAPADLMAYRLDKRLVEMYQKMERALLYNNTRFAGDANTGRLSGGLEWFIEDKIDIGAAALTFEDVEDVMQSKFESFGLMNVPDALWCNGWVKRVISSWGVPTIRTERTENVVGNEITLLETDFGTLTVNLDHLIIPSDVFILNMDKIQMAPLQGRGFAEWDASVAGDDMRRTRVLGEYVFVIKGEDGEQANEGLHAKLFDVSTVL